MIVKECIELSTALEFLGNAADYASGVDECTEHTIRQCISAIKKIPAIDPIRAAGGCRCGECRHWGNDGRCEPPKNGLIREYTKSTDFCSYGEPGEAQDDG